LDAQVRRDLRRWLREMHDRVRLTTVFVTHDQSDALELADQVAVLRAGRLQQLGTPAELIEAPANPFVFGFVGDSLRLACVVTNGWAVLDGLIHTPFPADCPSGRAVAMIRPHEVGIAPFESGGVPATLRDARQAGLLWHLKVAVGSGDATVEILAPIGIDLPPVGTAFSLDLSRARVYPAPSVNAT
jgi:sulfate transport system ATP-binding protein